MKSAQNKIIIVISIVILFVCSFVGYYFSAQTTASEKYKNLDKIDKDFSYTDISWTDPDISGVSDMSNINLLLLLSGDTYIPTKDELEKTMWDKNKVNIDVQYHDDPMDIANRYGVPFGSNIVYDKSGNKILLRSVGSMPPPVYFDPLNEIYNPTSFVPNYEESVLLRGDGTRNPI